MRTPGDERADAAWDELQRRMGAAAAERQAEDDATPLWLWTLLGFAVAILCGFVLVVVWPLVQAWGFFSGSGGQP